MPSACSIRQTRRRTLARQDEARKNPRAHSNESRGILPRGTRLRATDELGIIPLVAAAAPAALNAVGGIAKGIGGLFKKKKKHAPAPPPAAAAAGAGAAAHEAPAHESDASAHGQADLAGVPVDVKAQALEALKQYRSESKATDKTHHDLVTKLAKVIKPQVDKVHADVKTAALKSQVTSEHNRLVKEDERWKANDDAHKAIMAKFDELQAALNGSSKTTQRAFRIYGINI